MKECRYQNRDLEADFWGNNSYRDTTIDCVICQETIDDDNDNACLDGSMKDKTDELKQPVSLPGCGHWFHRSCAARWLERNNSCPMCRRAVKNVKECTRQGGEISFKILEMMKKGREFDKSLRFGEVRTSMTAPRPDKKLACK